jgi:hypothetical protein
MDKVHKLSDPVLYTTLGTLKILILCNLLHFQRVCTPFLSLGLCNAVSGIAKHPDVTA